LRLIALIYPTFTDNSGLINEIRERTHALADVVVVGKHIENEDNWKQMEDEAVPQLDDYIFVLQDTDYVDDVASLRRWLLLENSVAYACMRYYMHEGDQYRVDGSYKPHLMFQVFPYKPKAALHVDGLPTYSYGLPYINDPHLTVLSFRNYGKQKETFVTTEKWDNPIPEAASQG
jgi:hypothetical protein